MRIRTCIYSFLFLLFVKCGASQGSSTEIKETALGVMRSLISFDTASVFRMIDDSEVLNDLRENLESDIKKLRRFADKQQVPSLADINESVGPSGEQIAVVPMISVPDTTLNVRKSEMVVHFYPKRFRRNGVILGYAIIEYSIVQEELEFVHPPGVRMLVLNITAEDSVKQVVNNVFVGIEGSNSLLIEDCYTNDASLSAICEEGIIPANIKKLDFLKQFLGNSNCKTGVQKELELVKVEGPMADVKVSTGCPGNSITSDDSYSSFQLVRLNGNWKIQSMVLTCAQSRDSD